MYYKVKLTVKSVKGHCAAGHKEGDVILYHEPRIKAQGGGNMCLYALAALFPYITAYGRETAQDDWANSLKEAQCPDIENAVVFAFERTT